VQPPCVRRGGWLTGVWLGAQAAVMLRKSLLWREKFRPETITWDDVRHISRRPLSATVYGLSTFSLRQRGGIQATRVVG
jgi:hypothetical protein